MPGRSTITADERERAELRALGRSGTVKPAWRGGPRAGGPSYCVGVISSGTSSPTCCTTIRMRMGVNQGEDQRRWL